MEAAGNQSPGQPWHAAGEERGAEAPSANGGVGRRVLSVFLPAPAGGPDLTVVRQAPPFSYKLPTPQCIARVTLSKGRAELRPLLLPMSCEEAAGAGVFWALLVHLARGGAEPW